MKRAGAAREPHREPRSGQGQVARDSNGVTLEPPTRLPRFRASGHSGAAVPEQDDALAVSAIAFRVGRLLFAVRLRECPVHDFLELGLELPSRGAFAFESSSTLVLLSLVRRVVGETNAFLLGWVDGPGADVLTQPIFVRRAAPGDEREDQGEPSPCARAEHAGSVADAR